MAAEVPPLKRPRHDDAIDPSSALKRKKVHKHSSKPPRKSNTKFQAMDTPNQSHGALASELISQLSNGEENWTPASSALPWISSVSSLFLGERNDAPLDRSLKSIVSRIDSLEVVSTVVEYLRMWYMLFFKAKINRYAAIYIYIYC
jgi:hypothetical protein